MSIPQSVFEFLGNFVFGCGGGFMAVVLTELGLCPIIPAYFNAGKLWNGMALKVAFILCGGVMAAAWGASEIPLTNGLVLTAAGAGWHRLLLGWSASISAAKSLFEAWKKMGP